MRGGGREERDGDGVEWVGGMGGGGWRERERQRGREGGRESERARESRRLRLLGGSHGLRDRFQVSPIA
jgi:hypothetical protein